MMMDHEKTQDMYSSSPQYASQNQYDGNDHYNSQYHRYHSYYEEEFTEYEWRWLDTVRGLNFGFVVAIFVILAFQFQGPLSRAYKCGIARWRGIEPLEQDERDNASFLETFQDFFLQTFVTISDYTYIAWYMLAEFVRNIFWALSSFILIISGNGNRIENDRGRPGRRRPGRRGINALPDLQDDDSCTKKTRGTASSENNSWWHSSSLNTKELEPAFLAEKEFPGGWMVYHPSLGVVSKTIADKHDAEQLQRSHVKQVARQGKEPRKEKEAVEKKRENQVTCDLSRKPRTKSEFIFDEKKSDSDNSIDMQHSMSDEHDGECPSSEQPSELPILRSIAAA